MEVHLLQQLRASGKLTPALETLLIGPDAPASPEDSLPTLVAQVAEEADAEDRASLPGTLRDALAREVRPVRVPGMGRFVELRPTLGELLNLVQHAQVIRIEPSARFEPHPADTNRADDENLSAEE